MHARIAFNRPLSASYRHLGMAVPGFPGLFGPGQFVMVRLPLGADPLLPRAFSIYRISRADGDDPVVEILYKIVGKGTQHLAQAEPGQAVEILGPLGNSFKAPEAGLAVLVAGGIGVPPIAAWARSLAESRHSASRERTSIEVFLGGKSSDDILCVQDFEGLGASPHITTEDGSLGTCGVVTDVLGPFLLGPRPSALTLFTCGPPGMLAAVARLAERDGIPCQSSVEANMGCGFGACRGCAVEARTQGCGPAYKLVCKDGPVFDSRDLVWKA